MIDCVRDRQSEDVDILGRQSVAYRSERPRLIRQEQRELGRNFHILSLRYRGLPWGRSHGQGRFRDCGEIDGANFPEHRFISMPVAQYLLGPVTLSPFEVFVDEFLHRDDIRLGFETLPRDQFRIQAKRERLVQIQYVSNSSSHAGSEVFSGPAEDQQDAAGHIFTAVIADALDNRGHSGVSHSKAFSRPAGSEEFSTGRSDRKSTRLNSSHVKISYA